MERLLGMFGKHGLPGLVIAALFFLTFTLHKDNVKMTTTTIREVTLSAYELKSAIREQTEALRALELKGASYDSVLSPELGNNFPNRNGSADGVKRDNTQVLKVSRGVPRHHWVASQQEVKQVE
jgi:hypothetical protein